jgi:nucleoside 2-deoxyribosyltransferase
VKAIASYLRENGHEVDSFADDSTGRFVFHYSEIDSFENLDAINFLYDERSKKAFAEDKKWIDWSDCVLLVLPAGKSAHLEAGYAVGKGKHLIIYQQIFPKGEFDVMYGFADLITDDFKTIMTFLQNKDSDIASRRVEIEQIKKNLKEKRENCFA